MTPSLSTYIPKKNCYSRTIKNQQITKTAINIIRTKRLPRLLVCMIQPSRSSRRRILGSVTLALLKKRAAAAATKSECIKQKEEICIPTGCTSGRPVLEKIDWPGAGGQFGDGADYGTSHAIRQLAANLFFFRSFLLLACLIHLRLVNSFFCH